MVQLHQLDVVVFVYELQLVIDHLVVAENPIYVFQQSFKNAKGRWNLVINQK